MYTTVALLSVEMAAIDESSFCLLDFIESIQSIAVQETGDPVFAERRLTLEFTRLHPLPHLETIL
jgi:hypothetical protein